MTFRPGSQKPANSGRKRGVRNRATREVRAALLEAFDRSGGVEFLVGLADNDPATFARLLARLIPNEIAAHVDGIELVIERRSRPERDPAPVVAAPAIALPASTASSLPEPPPASPRDEELGPGQKRIARPWDRSAPQETADL